MRKNSKLVLILAIIMFLPAVKIFAAEDGKKALTLPQAEEQALANDNSLKTAKLNMDIAKSELESAARIVTVTGNLDFSQIYPDPLLVLPGTKNPSFTKKVQVNTKWNVTGVIALNDTSNVFGLNFLPFNLSQLLGVKNSEIGYLVKTQAYEAARLNSIVQVRNAYCEAFKNETLYGLAKENLQLVKEQYRQMNVFFNVGKVSKLDLMEAEQQVKSAEVSLVSAELSKNASFLKLGTLLGMDLLTGVTLNVDNLSWAVTDKIDIEASIAGCLKDAPDIKLALVNIELAKVNLQMDSYYHLKNLAVGVSETFPESGNNLTTYSLSISGPLDDLYFKKKSQSKMSLEAALLQLKTTTTARQTMILESVRLWKMAELGMEPAKEAVDIAKERLRIINLKFDNGMASSSEVNQIRQALSQTEQAYWQSWQSLQQAREGFYQAVLGKPVLKSGVK